MSFKTLEFAENVFDVRFGTSVTSSPIGGGHVRLVPQPDVPSTKTAPVDTRLLRDPGVTPNTLIIGGLTSDRRFTAASQAATGAQSAEGASPGRLVRRRMPGAGR